MHRRPHRWCSFLLDDSEVSMQVFPEPKLDQPAVRPPIDKAFVALAPEVHRALAHSKANNFPRPAPDSRGVLFELRLEASFAALDRDQAQSWFNSRLLGSVFRRCISWLDFTHLVCCGVASTSISTRPLCVSVHTAEDPCCSFTPSRRSPRCMA